MAEKIILFLSDFKDKAQKEDYKYPGKKPRAEKIPGTQTNDAPVRYLLQAHPEISEVICVVTKLARKSALAYFKEVVREKAPEAVVVPIPYNEKKDFSVTVIPAILDRVEREDEIYLDVTGGFRNINMHLLLLSRVLAYKGIHTAGVVYSNWNTHTVEDVSHLFRLFDLVSGMQELTSLGSVRTLRSYYRAEPGAQDPSVEALIGCMDRLTEDITLCHTELIQQRMAEFNEAMGRAKDCPDTLTRHLLDVFQKTFGTEMTVPGLVRWCVDNNMVQQALTVYTEHIPDVIMGGRVLRREFWVEDVPKKAYENQDTVQFLRGFLALSARSGPGEDLCGQLRKYVRENAAGIRREVRHEPPPAPPPEIALGVENIALAARLAYPNGRFDPSWAENLPPEKAGLGALNERLSGRVPGTMQGFINDVAVFTAAHIDVLLEREGQDDDGPRKSLRAYIRAKSRDIQRMAQEGGAPAPVPPEIAVGVENLVLVARLAYPNGRFDPSWANRLPPGKAGLGALNERLSGRAPGTTQGFINDVAVFSGAHLNVLLELGDREDGEAEETDEAAGNVYIQTLRRLEELLPGSGYVAQCSLERLAQVCRDYLYIKTLRNMVNHALDSSANNHIQEQLLRYLDEFGYKRPENLSLADIQTTVRDALDNLKKAEEE